MKYHIFNFSGETMYSTLVNLAFEKCTYFSVCTFKYYHKKDLSKNFNDFLDKINPFRVESTHFIIPKNYTKGQQYHIFKLDPIAKTLIKDVRSFADWRLPYYPEDLTFYRAKKPWLSSISHEDMLFIETEDPKVSQKFTDLGLTLREY